jgi:hypothetical protein
VFTARYALSPYIKQTRFVFKGLISSETADGFRGMWFTHEIFEVSHIRGVSFGAWQTPVPYQKTDILPLLEFHVTIYFDRNGLIAFLVSRCGTHTRAYLKL